VSQNTIRFEKSSRCPCESGKTVQQCSCEARNFVPVAVDANPRGIITGITVAKCYARSMRNCRPPMSVDHAIAAAISEDFQNSPIARILRDGTSRFIPPGSAGRKVLCKRHNSSLSDLDEIGRRFVRASKDHLGHHEEKWPDDAHVLFNGYDVERWMLKVLCTLAYDEPVSRVHPSRKWRVPDPWLHILFSGRPFPRGAGLYVPRVARARLPGAILAAKILGTRQRRLGGGGRLIGSSTLDVIGISLSIYGQDFDLHMTRPKEAPELWYRPRMFRARNDAGAIHYIHLGWDEHPPTFRGRLARVDREHPRDDLLT
jgi:hypothetical protein